MRCFRNINNSKAGGKIIIPPLIHIICPGIAYFLFRGATHHPETCAFSGLLG